MSEEWFQRNINDWQFDNGIALDIGANHGHYTKLLANKFAVVYAFEPHPENFAILEKDGLVNVFYVNIAIGDKVADEVRLFTNPNPGGHSISEKVGSDNRFGHRIDNFIKVPMTTVDMFCSGLTKISAIKIDVEGAEEYVLSGALETLKKNKVNILLETHQTIDCEKIYSMMTGIGYSFIDESGPQQSIRFDHHYLVTNH